MVAGWWRISGHLGSRGDSNGWTAAASQLVLGLVSWLAGDAAHGGADAVNRGHVHLLLNPGTVAALVLLCNEEHRCQKYDCQHDVNDDA